MLRGLSVIVAAFGVCAAQVPTDGVGISIGGYGGATSAEVMIADNACMGQSSNPNIPNAPVGFMEGWCMEYVDDALWLCGGADLNFHSECYTIAIGGSFWTQMDSMNDARDYASSMVMNGEMVMLGGYNNNNGWLDSVEKKTAGAGTWTEMEWDLPRGTFDLCADQVDDTHLIITGGNTYGSSANEYIDAVEIIDISTGAVEVQDPIPGGARASHGCITTEVNGEKGLLLAGGCANKCQDHLDDAYFFSYSSKTWTTLASMTLPRMGFKMTHINGMPTAIGGYNTDLLSETEMYDAATDTWLEHPTGMVNDRWAYGMPKYVPASLVTC